MKTISNKGSSKHGLNLPDNFHVPPTNHKYVIEPFNAKFNIIKLIHPDVYTYTSERVWTVWGFVCKKTGKFYAPINAQKPGDEVSWPTTAYTSMRPPVQRTLSVSVLDFC
jgi:hypothetical protein